jgi:hypothetical protein
MITNIAVDEVFLEHLENDEKHLPRGLPPTQTMFPNLKRLSIVTSCEGKE